MASAAAPRSTTRAKWIASHAALPTIPAYAVSAEASGADLSVQPLPNPSNELSIGSYPVSRGAVPGLDRTRRHLRCERRRDDIDRAARHNEAITTQLGWNVVYDGEYNALGETTWRPFIEAMRGAGVRGLVYVGEPGNLGAVPRRSAVLRSRLRLGHRGCQRCTTRIDRRRGHRGRRHLRAHVDPSVPHGCGRRGQRGHPALPRADGALRPGRQDRVPRRTGTLGVVAVRQGCERMRCRPVARLRLGEGEHDHRVDWWRSAHACRISRAADTRRAAGASWASSTASSVLPTSIRATASSCATPTRSSS